MSTSNATSNTTNDSDGYSEGCSDGCYGNGVIVGAVLGTFFSTVVLVASLGVACYYYVIRRPQLRHQNEFKLKQMNDRTKENDSQRAEAFSLDEFSPTNQKKRTNKTARNSSISTRNDRRSIIGLSNSEDLNQIKQCQQMGRNSWMALLNRKRSSLDSRVPKASSLTLRTSKQSSGPRHSKASIQSSLYGEQRFDLFEVPLQSNDPVGLGFNVFGNLLEGIFVTELLSRGPARDCGLINPGDRIVSLAVNTEHMVLEDALTILSYASSYPVKLLLLREVKPRHGQILDPENNNDPSNTTTTDQCLDCFPHFRFRSQSMEDLSMYRGKESNFRFTDKAFASNGSWNLELPAQNKRRSYLFDDCFWSGTRGWRSEDDWFRQGETQSGKLGSMFPHGFPPSTILSCCTASSQASISSANVRQRRIPNYLDLSRIADSDNYLTRIPGCRLGSRSLNRNELGWMNSWSLQTISARPRIRQNNPRTTDHRLVVERRAVSDDVSYHFHESGSHQRPCCSLSGKDIKGSGHVGSNEQPSVRPVFSISYSDSFKSAGESQKVNRDTGKTEKTTKVGDEIDSQEKEKCRNSEDAGVKSSATASDHQTASFTPSDQDATKSNALIRPKYEEVCLKQNTVEYF